MYYPTYRPTLRYPLPTSRLSLKDFFKREGNDVSETIKRNLLSWQQYGRERDFDSRVHTTSGDMVFAGFARRVEAGVARRDQHTGIGRTTSKVLVQPLTICE